MLQRDISVKFDNAVMRVVSSHPAMAFYPPKLHRTSIIVVLIAPSTK